MKVIIDEKRDRIAIMGLAFIGLVIINSMSADKPGFRISLSSLAYAMFGAFIVDPKAFVFFSIEIFLKSADNRKKKWRGRSNIAVAAKGNFLMRVANVLPKGARICIEQSVSDMRIEYFDALSEKNKTKAKIVIICFYFSLMWAFLDFAGAKIKSLLWFIPKSE